VAGRASTAMRASRAVRVMAELVGRKAQLY